MVQLHNKTIKYRRPLKIENYLNVKVVYLKNIKIKKHKKHYKLEKKYEIILKSFNKKLALNFGVKVVRENRSFSVNVSYFATDAMQVSIKPYYRSCLLCWL